MVPSLTTGGADCSVRVWNVELEGSANEIVSILYPLRSYHTKYTPVYYVNYSPSDLITPGGPYNNLFSLAFGGGTASSKKN